MVIEHIIAGYSIPHNEGAVPLTKEAYDVNNPQKRLTDFSKTITIPENKTVNQIFEHAFDANIDLQTFNPNLKTSYQIIQDGITAIDGYCQLKAIPIVAVQLLTIFVLFQAWSKLVRSKSCKYLSCLLYTSPSPRDRTRSRMPSSA